MLFYSLLLLSSASFAQSGNVSVADANGNKLRYSFDSADGPATFTGIDSYATDESKAGHIIIADNVIDADGNTHEVNYIGGSISNRNKIISIVFGQNIIATGGSDGNSNDAFYACPQLRKVTLNNRLETLGRYTFQSCNSLEDINLGDATGLKTIMLKAFQNADNLRSLELPESVSLIEESAFEGCDSLRSFTFLGMSSLTNIPKNCFAGCVSLENITLPDAVKTLSAGCFYNTPSLTEIIFGTGITSLSDDNYVFGYFNANLKKMTFPGAVYPFLKEYYLPSDIVLYVRPDLIDTYKENSFTKELHFIGIGQSTAFDITTTAGGQLQVQVEAQGDANNVIQLTVTGPIRDNKVHALIAFQKGRDNKPYSFQIEFEPAPLNRLEVKSIETVPQGDAIATDVLDELTVSFNKPVKPETFTRNDMVLRYEGEKQTSDILITKAADNDSVFTLKMNNVDRNSYYTLLVNTVDVTDTEDFTGLDGKQVGWMLFKGGLVQYNVEPWPSVQAGNVTTSNNGVTSGDVIYGADVTMTATPQDGYTFDYWGTVDEAIESIASSRGRLKGETSAPQIQESQIGRYSTENPVVVPMKKACNMRAVFKPKTYTVTFVYDGNQGEFNATSAVYNHGDRLSLRATPAEGYSFVGYSDGSAILSTAAEYEYTVTGPATITVLFKSDAPEEILLRESIDYTPAAVNNANVRLQRTFEKSLWNTVCVPFDIDEPANVFGEGTQVARLNGIDGNVVQFSTVTGMEANVPYLIMSGKLNNNQDISDSTSAISIYSISNTEIVPPGATMSECSGGVEMIGTYINSDIPAAGDYYVLSTNLLEYIGIGAEIPSGRFRAYFHIPGTTGETLKIAIDGIITGIGLQLQPVTRKGDIYTLSGVLLHKNADINTLRRQGRLQPGIYIMNGQKIVVK